MAFLANRNIIQNVLLCQDLAKHYGQKQYTLSCLLKIDIAKLMTRWTGIFLMKMLMALGFPAHFIRILMKCLTSKRYSLLVNGNLMEAFSFKYGLKQGDHVSPLIFKLGMGYLLRILNTNYANKAFHYHPRCKAIKLNQLCFTDDLMMFCRADIDFPRCYLTA